MRIARQHTVVVGAVAGLAVIMVLGLFSVRLAYVVRAVNHAHAQAAARAFRRECAGQAAMEARCLDARFRELAASMRLAAARPGRPDDDGGGTDVEPRCSLAMVLALNPELEGIFLPGRGLIRTPHGGMLEASLETVVPSLERVAWRAALPTEGLMLCAAQRGSGAPVILGVAALPEETGVGMGMVIWAPDDFVRMLAPCAGVAGAPVASRLAGPGGMTLAAWPAGADAEGPGRDGAGGLAPPPPPAGDDTIGLSSPLSAAVDAAGAAWRLEHSWVWADNDHHDEFLPGVGLTQARSMLVAGIVTTAMAMLFFFVVLGVLTRHALAPLRQALEFAQRLGRGEFAAELRSRRRDEFGDLIRALNVMRDRMQSSLTSLRQSHGRERQARQELETAERLRAEFLSRMSGDFRPPIDFILSAAATLREEARSGRLPEGLRHQAEAMHGHARRLHDLIGSLLSLTTLESHRVEPKIAELEISAFLRELLDLHQHAAEARDIALHCEYASDLPTVINTDRDLLLNLLSVLVTSLVELAGPGTAVAVGCRAGPHELAFWLRGAPSPRPGKTLAELFNDYTRLDPDLMPHYGGEVVLRLAIAKAHAQLLHASLVAETLDDGASLFQVVFRKSDVVFFAATETASIHIASNWRQQMRSDEATPGSDGTVAERRLRILLADADPAACDRVGEILCEAEIGFDAVDNGKDALEALCRRRYDLLLLDLDVPQVSPRRIVAKLRAEPLLAKLPIVIAAEQIGAGERDALLAAGVNEFLSKPIQMDDLIRTITALVE